MELILWRHAEAEHGGNDAARALTKRGHKQAKLMAAWLDKRLGKEWTILASPAVRGQQTAAALGRKIDTRERLDTSSGAKDVLREAGWTQGGGGKVVVVGHQPTLGLVAGMLLGSHEDVAFRKGAVWWFVERERDGRSETVLKAVLNPDLLED